MFDDVFREDFYNKIIPIMKSKIKDPQSKIILNNFIADSAVTLSKFYWGYTMDNRSINEYNYVLLTPIFIQHSLLSQNCSTHILACCTTAEVLIVCLYFL